MANEEQIAQWNGEAGEHWAQRDARMSEVLAPFSAAVMEHAGIYGAKTALDIGCGGGSQTLALAERLGPDASVLGVDVSAPLLAIAEAQRTAHPAGERVRFERGDASAYDFSPAGFDLLFSRFGVMFFDAPTQAFRHLRGAAKPGAKLAFCCWQELSSNPFVAVPLQAALSVLPPPPPPTPRAPGPFAFAEHDYLGGLLDDAGWTSIDVTPRHIPMRWGGHEDFSTTVHELVNVGPIGRMLNEAKADDATRDAVYHTAEELLAPFYMNRALHMDGAVWLVTASNGD